MIYQDHHVLDQTIIALLTSITASIKSTHYLPSFVHFKTYSKHVQHKLIIRMVGVNDFKPRKRVKEILSQNPATARTRKYEQALSGLDAALLKVGRNQRTARSRARALLRASPGWSTWTQEERKERERVAVLEIDEKYDQQRAEVQQQWAEDDSEESESSEQESKEDDMPMSDIAEEDDSNESDRSNPEFDGAEDEPEVDGEFGVEEYDKEGNRVVSDEVRETFEEILAKGAKRIAHSVKGFARWGDVDEKPLSDSSESVSPIADSMDVD
jgi:hypothetical protein